MRLTSAIGAALALLNGIAAVRGSCRPSSLVPSCSETRCERRQLCRPMGRAWPGSRRQTKA
jgi:hypothetical protein